MATLYRTASAILTHSRVANTAVVIARHHTASLPHRLLHVRNQQDRRLTRAHAKRATEADELEIEEMKRAAEKGDILDGGAADVLVKVLAVAAFVGFVTVIAFLGQPVIQNTLAIFPSAS